MLTFGAVFLMLVSVACGQVALYDPPARGAMWRFGYGTPTNWNDHFLNCGGMTNQFEQQGGRCGRCGDPHQNSKPRENELGGKYGSGVKSSIVLENGWIVVNLDFFNANGGYLQFKVCNYEAWGVESGKCFNEHGRLLVYNPTYDGQTPLKRYPLHQHNGVLKVYLPYQLRSSSHLILQMKYHSGCCWGCKNNGKCCVGCGPKQEEFYNCADFTVNNQLNIVQHGATNSTAPPEPVQ